MADAQHRRHLRNRNDTLFHTCFGVFSSRGRKLRLVALLITPADSADKLPPATWAFVGLLLVKGVLSLAFARTAVLIAADSERFEVRNSWATSQVAWSDVKGFRPGIFSGFVTNGYRWPVVVVELNDAPALSAARASAASARCRASSESSRRGSLDTRGGPRPEQPAA